MAYYFVTATGEAASGLSDDSFSNGFAFASDVEFGAAERLDVFNAIVAFYTQLQPGQTNRVDAYISASVSRVANAGILKMYDVAGHLDGSPHGSPIAESVFTLGAIAGQSTMPPQAAVVITLRGREAITLPVEEAPNIRPRSRQTGRLFIGPLTTAAGELDGEQRFRVSDVCRTDLLLAAEGLQDALVDGDYQWCVWSRANAAMEVIVRAEVDNSFDVLRSRKLDATARTVRTFNPVPAVVLAA